MTLAAKYMTTRVRDNRRQVIFVYLPFTALLVNNIDSIKNILIALAMPQDYESSESETDDVPSAPRIHMTSFYLSDSFNFWLCFLIAVQFAKIAVFFLIRFQALELIGSSFRYETQVRKTMFWRPAVEHW